MDAIPQKQMPTRYSQKGKWFHVESDAFGPSSGNLAYSRDAWWKEMVEVSDLRANACQGSKPPITWAAMRNKADAKMRRKHIENSSEHSNRQQKRTKLASANRSVQVNGNEHVMLPGEGKIETIYVADMSA